MFVYSRAEGEDNQIFEKGGKLIEDPKFCRVSDSESREGKKRRRKQLLISVQFEYTEQCSVHTISEWTMSTSSLWRRDGKFNSLPSINESGSRPRARL